ncbi:MAG: hypothetical protein RIQ93_81 [Verrucomicrobiota bacterium]|jgi:uncharacterized OsmC-like protein
MAVAFLSLGWLTLLPLAAAQPTHTAKDWAQAPANFTPRDSLQDYLGRLKSALLVLADQPEQEQPLKLMAHVVAEGRTGIRRLGIRDFQFLSDGAPATGEFNLGPGSWPTVVGVLGSAVAQDFLIQAALKGIPLDQLEVVFTSRPGAAPASGGRARVAYPRDLAYTAYIVSSATDAVLEELRQTVERVSPVLNLVSQSQTIEHGTLIHQPTPAKPEGKTLEGLREFLAEKRAAAAGAKPPAIPRLAPRGAGGPRGSGGPSLRAHVKVEAGSGIRHVRTEDDNFQIIHDSPRYLAGHNLGPVAEEHLLGVMITCLTHIYEMQAASRNVLLDSLELEVEATLAPRLGSTVTPPRLKDIRYRVYIGSPESKETIEQLQQAVEAICPIYNMLKDAQPINGRIVRGPYR